jgi:hypothetical protein
MTEGFPEGNSPALRGFGLEPVRSWMRRVLGLDRAIGFTVLARFWASAAGLITVVLIVRFLSPAEQGYYYTFGSLVALQIMFELGFSFVILQMASHERAHLDISPDYEITGDPVAHARLASVFQKSVRWYSAGAILLAAFLSVAGSYFFSTHQHGASVSWHVPWYAVAIATAVTFQIDPILSFLEGCGFVSNVARLRLVQAMTGSFLAWGALLCRQGLFAPAMIVAGNVLVASPWLYRKRKLLLGLLRYKPDPHRIQWKKEVWPFQWRIAISWLSGYFIYQLFNPVLFAYHGPVAAGRMGMSLTLANALQSVAISWINTKSAPFGTMIARKKYDELDHSFFKALQQSVAVFLAGAFLICCVSVYLAESHNHFAQRILDPAILGILLLSTAINVTIFGLAIYLRAHKQEKLLFNSVVGAVLVASSTYFLGRLYGAAGMVLGNFAAALLFGLPSALFVFIKYRRVWHAV